MANLRAFAELFQMYSPLRTQPVTTLVFTIHFYAKATTRQSHSIKKQIEKTARNRIIHSKAFQQLF